MSKNQSLNFSTSHTNLDQLSNAVDHHSSAPKRRINPWHLFGWVRKKLKTRREREFYSFAEKRRHQHTKMSQRVANHHHGFKF